MPPKGIDIRNKCPNNETGSAGPCQDDNRIEVKGGTLKGTNYEYCTHSWKNSIWIINPNYGGRLLKIEEGVGGKPTSFNIRNPVVWEITTYYHKDYDKNASFIKAPLVLRINNARYGDHYEWYENAGDGIKWKKIDTADGFPKNNKNPVNQNFTEKLNKLACQLHRLHRLNLYKKDIDPPYNCPICKNARVTVQQESKIKDVYSRFKHILTEDGKYCVYYKDALIKYQESSSGKFTALEVTNKNHIYVYYWDGDIDHINPLLIEVKLSTVKSNWYENARYGDDKNDKWRKLEDAINLSSPENLKDKLDILSCMFNGTVRIKLGLTSNCHNTRDGRHKDKLKSCVNGIFHKELSISFCEYTPREVSGSDSFHVAEILLGGARQTFPGGTSLKGVTKVSSYESKCSPGVPFLLCIETGTTSKKYQWYWKEEKGDKWKECPKISSEKSPENSKGEIETIFSVVKGPLKITQCKPSRPLSGGIQMDIKRQPTGDKPYDMYKANSSPGNVPIALVKTLDSPVRGFFRVTHTANMATGSFTLSGTLVGGDGIRGISNPIDSVSVYYWNSNDQTPILLEINDTNGNTKYYSYADNYTVSVRRNGIWAQRGYESLKHTDLEEMLDDQNCHRNITIPIDLKDPANLKPFYKTIEKKATPYLRNKRVTPGTSPNLPRGAKRDYEIEICNVKNEISRVTYGGKEITGIEPPRGKSSELRKYKWKHAPDTDSKVPLLVEFISSGKSSWYENLDKDSLTWASIGDDEDVKIFYSGHPPQGPFTEELTEKLDEVSCRVHHTVGIDISRKNTGRSYCHSECYPKKIKVTHLKNPRLPDYNIYEHSPAPTGQKTFTVTSIVYGNKEQALEQSNLTFPLREVSKVIVYFPVCNGDHPVAIRVERNGESATWLKNESGEWMQFNPKDDIIETLNQATSGLNLCPAYPKPRPQQGDVNGTEDIKSDEEDEDNNGGERSTGVDQAAPQPILQGEDESAQPQTSVQQAVAQAQKVSDPIPGSLPRETPPDHHDSNNPFWTIEKTIPTVSSVLELLQKQCAQAKRDLEDNKTEYSLIVSELKERYVALENILHENQEQLRESEANLARKDSQISAMNSELIAKSETIEKLTKRMEYLNNYYKDSLENKYRDEKLKFDLQRFSLLNCNNIYLQCNNLNSDGVTILEFSTKTIDLFSAFFRSWKEALRTVEYSQVVTDSALITELKNSFAISESSSSGDETMENNSSAETSPKCLELCHKIDKHLEAMLEIFKRMTEKTHSFPWHSQMPKLISHTKSFVRLQRIYFCVEEYTHPYDSKDLVKHSTKLLIQTLGDISGTIAKIYVKFQSIVFLTQKKSDRCFDHLLSTLLTNYKSGKTKLASDSHATASDSAFTHEPPLGTSSSSSKKLLENLDKFIDKSYKNIFLLTKRLASLMLELKQCLSQRLCHPKLANGSFLPLCGGSSEMVALTTCVNELSQHIPLLNELSLRSLFSFGKTSCGSLYGVDKEETNPAIVRINAVNESLKTSQPRLKFDNLKNNLDLIRQHENTLEEWKEKVKAIDEELSIANIKCKQYESELEALKDTQKIETACTRAFSRLETVLSQPCKELSASATSTHHDSAGAKSEEDEKKLLMHIKHLIKSVNNLETHNKQLKMTIELNKQEYERARENEDSLHRKYSEQLSYMNEHICELNNNILSSEYKIAELTQAKVQCPSCGFNNTLGRFSDEFHIKQTGSMVGSGNNKGKCSSCKGIVLHSTI
ncbi:hypothetical protein BEWA_031570 [Theileria equi strain WA]|uniref:Uncharacterized protein n=1 Tax=Theileria equi strain WA TaxID=1537102 RepID=L0AZH7_THEEQ|nr:hypothetical protein BEWA_031570 [Theileria equi strain WA]AFZ80304.1 hypothetical protein BEWA_031570 [Theileria equi strain WA]|eukprot:XP_004829970.1 hypothetical protein BEWA_031570 [Theileria equi strain WA]